MSVFTASLRSHLTQTQDVPIVFNNLICNWGAAHWDPSTLSHVFGTDVKLKFRIGPRDAQSIIWESDCCFEDATIQNFIDWNSGTADASNPLSPYHRDVCWCYADYKHLGEMFKDKHEILNMIDWSTLGFEGRGGKESTFWLGSCGAHTLCHYDSYGCNLVAQIHGRKRWTLFPPSDMDNLYPTRLPYEESSVFSDVNIRCPDLATHERFKNVQPYIVTLEPGQVLFVPPKWWHFVESLDTTISVNSWIEMASDDNARLTESVTRLIVMSIMNDSERDPVEWQNPTESHSSFEENLKLIIHSFEQLQSQDTKTTDSHKDNSSSSDNMPEGKKPHLTCTPCRCADGIHCVLPPETNNVPLVTFQSFMKQITTTKEAALPVNTEGHVTQSAAERTRSKTLDLKTIVNTIVHPTVITTICKNLNY